MTRFARVCVLIAALFVPSVLSAQTALSTTTCPGAGCVVYDVQGMGSTGVQITGVFNGTLQFEQSKIAFISEVTEKSIAGTPQ